MEIVSKFNPKFNIGEKVFMLKQIKDIRRTRCHRCKGTGVVYQFEYDHYCGYKCSCNEGVVEELMGSMWTVESALILCIKACAKCGNTAYKYKKDCTEHGKPDENEYIPENDCFLDYKDAFNEAEKRNNEIESTKRKRESRENRSKDIKFVSNESLDDFTRLSDFNFFIKTNPGFIELKLCDDIWTDYEDVSTLRITDYLSMASPWDTHMFACRSQHVEEVKKFLDGSARDDAACDDDAYEDNAWEVLTKSKDGRGFYISYLCFDGYSYDFDVDDQIAETCKEEGLCYFTMLIKHEGDEWRW